MLLTKVSGLHSKTPMITYGTRVAHKTSMHTYKTINVDHTQSDHSPAGRQSLLNLDEL